MIIFIAISFIIAMIVLLCMNLQAKRLVIKSEESIASFRIVHISDLHFDKVLVSPTLLVKEIYKQRPEIVVITGDLCSKLRYFERVLNFLDMLSYKCDCDILITLGNHDNKIFKNEECTKDEYIYTLENVSKRIKVLENETFIYKDILFAGLGDYKNNDEDYTLLTEKWNEKAKNLDKKLIILTHNPDISIKINKLSNLEIILAGHTHGGQIKTPFNIEFNILKKDILPKKKIYYGNHIVNDNKLFITSGIGCTFLPMRLKSTAEIVIFQ